MIASTIFVADLSSLTDRLSLFSSCLYVDEGQIVYAGPGGPSVWGGLPAAAERHVQPGCRSSDSQLGARFSAGTERTALNACRGGIAHCMRGRDPPYQAL